ncbi:MAG: glycosyltransferase family 9 protein [Candidatus Krumholzibacteria bacterium]|nr:glycosyltransferase family 9 protein [Candidatus Krumholzibacteria bacterium]
MKVLLVRCDRLGDLVLALPAIAWLRAARPAWEIHALVAAHAVPVVENDPAIDAFYTWEGQADAELIRRLQAERYDAAVLLQYQMPLARLLRAARIGRSYGPLSKWTSWLLLNRGSWQRRSRASRHESQLNVDLVRRLAGRAGGAGGAAAAARSAGGILPPRLHLNQEQRRLGRRFREQEAGAADVVAFVHPGSGGSALDWPAASFAAVANDLAARRGWRVFVTGSHHDRPAIDAMAPHLSPQVAVVAERFPLRDFLGVLSAGDLLIAPSTGPLHLAAALDLAAVGVYPPAPTMSPRRWGPLGRWARAIVPPVECPSRRHCLQSSCLFYNCLEAVLSAQVIELATALVAARRQELAGTARSD